MGHSVTALLLSYNHEQFVRQALESILGQNYGAFQLVIADDASTDGTRKIIEHVLAEHRLVHVEVTTLFQPSNLGLIGNFNSAMAAATGDIVITCAGDDISEPNRFRVLEQLFADPGVQLACSAYTLIDEGGVPLKRQPCLSPWSRGPYSYKCSARSIYARSPVCGATVAFRRRLHELFGPLSPGTHGEDNALWIRALLIGSIATPPLTLVRWRQHANNLSNFETSGLGLQEARHRRLRHIEAHALMAPQWLRDIEHARSIGLIPGSKASMLTRLAEGEALFYETLFLVLGGESRRTTWSGHLFALIASGRIKLAWRLARYRLFPWKTKRLWAKMGLV